MTLTDVRLLAGDPEQLERKAKVKVDVAVLSEYFRDAYTMRYDGGGNMNRAAANTLDLGIFSKDVEALELGRR